MQVYFNQMGGIIWDYVLIGQQVRKYRKALGLSQEELAERVEISVPHMSHIETANTKLSLPVLVALAEALEVRTDDLLYDVQSQNRAASAEEISSILNLNQCTAQQAEILADILRAAKISLDKHT